MPLFHLARPVLSTSWADVMGYFGPLVWPLPVNREVRRGRKERYDGWHLKIAKDLEELAGFPGLTVSKLTRLLQE